MKFLVCSDDTECKLFIRDWKREKSHLTSALLISIQAPAKVHSAEVFMFQYSPLRYIYSPLIFSLLLLWSSSWEMDLNHRFERQGDALISPGPLEHPPSLHLWLDPAVGSLVQELDLDTVVSLQQTRAHYLTSHCDVTTFTLVYWRILSVLWSWIMRAFTFLKVTGSFDRAYHDRVFFLDIRSRGKKFSGMLMKWNSTENERRTVDCFVVIIK